MYTVIQGNKIGKKIGFPTINLKPAKIDADFGVYTCEVFLEKGEQKKGLLHYGKRETTDGKISLEIHLLDFNREIYGTKVKIKIGQKIRETNKFKNLQELKKQIKKDFEKAKDFF